MCISTFFWKHLPFFLGGKSKIIPLYSKFGAKRAWIFGVSVYQFAAPQQTITTKIKITS